MSRAFVKEGAPEAPLVVPPRPALPDGVPNYVTPAGLAALRAEKAEITADRARLGAEAEGASRQREFLTARLRDLVQRLAIAKLVPLRERDEARFGATVTVRRGGSEQTFQIVGVDEAATRDDAVAFTSPLARAVNGARAGDAVPLQTPRGEERLEVVRVRYATRS